jgi:Bacterial protein of unknown function (YtfJ_HI0045)
MRPASIIAGALVACLAGSARALPTLGSTAPSLTLPPVDGTPLELSSALGRPTLIFYESKQSRGQNWPFKKRLKDLVAASSSYRERVALFPIADLEGYDFWPVRGFAADAVRAEARRIGWPIYCDWRGDLRKALDVRREMSSVILVDHAGKIIFASEGPLDPASQDEVLELLRVELDS